MRFASPRAARHEQRLIFVDDFEGLLGDIFFFDMHGPAIIRVWFFTVAGGIES